MRVGQFLVITSLLAAACFDGSPTFPESGSVELESTPLLSGGEGVLVSEAYARFFLTPRHDTTGAVRPRRWTNFRVEVDGAEVDSWRIDSTRIGFRVPRVATGMLAVDAVGSPAAGASFSVRTLGGLFLGRLNDPCGSTGIPRLIPMGQEIIWSGTWCPLTFRGDDWFNGYASIRPAVPGAEMTFIKGAHEISDTFAVPTSAGTSFDPERTILELPGTFGTGTATWLWTMGANPEPLEPIACLPSGSWPGAALAEVAPGVCVSFDPETGRLMRNGVVIDECCRLSPGTFRVSSTGMAVLKDVFVLRFSHWPIVDATGQVVRRIEEYERVTGVVFSPDGSRLYVRAFMIGTEAWVLDVRSSTTGDLVNRVVVDPGFGLALEGDYLYLEAEPEVDGVRQRRVERRNVSDLTLDRAVAVQPSPSPFSDSFGMPVEIITEPNGRRVHMVGWIEDNLGVVGYTVDFE